MSVTFIGYVALLSGLIASGAVACDRPPDTAVTQAVVDMYAAATADDLNAFHAVTTPGFYAFESGRRFEGDALMNLIKAGHSKGTVWVWTVTAPEVHATCDMAWVAYTNVGSVTTADGSQSVKWLESAILVPDGEHWRIAFFSSTRVPQP